LLWAVAAGVLSNAAEAFDIPAGVSGNGGVRRGEWYGAAGMSEGEGGGVEGWRSVRWQSAAGFGRRRLARGLLKQGEAARQGKTRQEHRAVCQGV
jgi:hypothetical protein